MQLALLRMHVLRSLTRYRMGDDGLGTETLDEIFRNWPSLERTSSSDFLNSKQQAVACERDTQKIAHGIRRTSWCRAGEGIQRSSKKLQTLDGSRCWKGGRLSASTSWKGFFEMSPGLDWPSNRQLPRVIQQPLVPRRAVPPRQICACSELRLAVTLAQ